MSLTGIELELFRQRFAAIADEMGDALTRAAFSPNIKERRDHSCAVFDSRGDMVAQAAHIPVHLGAAPACVREVIARVPLSPGETAIVNDPYAGGTHLPDVTLVTAARIGTESMYVATRAHHADVGGIAPGSLPLSKTIDDEGWRCAPSPATPAVLQSLIDASRTPWERRGDLEAQFGANRMGAARLGELAARFGVETTLTAAAALLDHGERVARAWLAEVMGARQEFESGLVEDWLDEAQPGGAPVGVRLNVRAWVGGLEFDFSESDDEVAGPMNAPRAIVESAVMYALLCCMGPDAVANSGLMRLVTVKTRRGSLLDPTPPSAVAAGNVETSQRLVDVTFEALRGLVGAAIPAASYGTMNNVLIGTSGKGPAPFVIYETLGGGHGGGMLGKGASAMQAHMTNTLNTPVEALEHAFPLRVVRYAVRRGSGGAGLSPGGDGLAREYEIGVEAELTLISERRRHVPPGAYGGGDGSPGGQWLFRAGVREELAGKASVRLEAGDRLVVETPGGGGWGRKVGA